MPASSALNLLMIGVEVANEELTKAASNVKLDDQPFHPLLSFLSLLKS